MQIEQMKRREFITLLSSAAVVAWPLAARAQQPARLPTIGVLVAGAPSSHGRLVEAFVRGSTFVISARVA
jgi:putative ABC transport system substrate-binding protein